MSKLEYILILSNGDKEIVIEHTNKLRKETNEELVNSYNKSQSLGIVGSKQQALYLVALRLIMKERFGKSPIYINDNFVLGLSCKIVLIDRSIYPLYDSFEETLKINDEKVKLLINLTGIKWHSTYSKDSVQDIVDLILKKLSENVENVCKALVNYEDRFSDSVCAVYISRQMHMGGLLFGMQIQQLAQILIHYYSVDNLIIETGSSKYIINKGKFEAQ